jgi:uncharacterized protein YndB with AHSA1/START domain
VPGAIEQEEIPMPYTYTLTTTIPASARAIYDAWLDSIAHSEMTGSAAEMSDEIGAEVSAWDGYISGRNLELVPGERIVQSWRTTKFNDDQDDSIVTVLLEDGEDGTLLTLIHSNVPNDHRTYEEGGWESNYFEPMQSYFAAIGPEEEEEPAPAPAPVRPAAEPAAPQARRATSAPKRSAPKAKAAPAKRKSKRAAAAKSKRKTAPSKKRVKATKKKSAKRPAAKATKRRTKRKAAPRKHR